VSGGATAHGDGAPVEGLGLGVTRFQFCSSLRLRWNSHPYWFLGLVAVFGLRVVEDRSRFRCIRADVFSLVLIEYMPIFSGNLSRVDGHCWAGKLSRNEWLKRC
jgi:hypothetical protein